MPITTVVVHDKDTPAFLYISTTPESIQISLALGKKVRNLGLCGFALIALWHCGTGYIFHLKPGTESTGKSGKGRGKERRAKDFKEELCFCNSGSAWR